MNNLAGKLTSIVIQKADALSVEKKKILYSSNVIAL